jgi:hypothetical protein
MNINFYRRGSANLQLVESLLSKVIHEFERRLANQNDLVCSYFSACFDDLFVLATLTTCAAELIENP